MKKHQESSQIQMTKLIPMALESRNFEQRNLAGQPIRSKRINNRARITLISTDEEKEASPNLFTMEWNRAVMKLSRFLFIG